MSVAISPDGRTLAIDLQGSIWTMPAVGRRDDAHHRRLRRRAPADVVARRTSGSRSSRIATAATTSGRSTPDGTEPAEADLGAVRRSRADLVARRHAPRLLVGSRQPARQRLQHLDPRHCAAARSRSSPRSPSKTSCRRGRLTTREIAFASTRENGQPVVGGQRGAIRRRAQGPHRHRRRGRRAVVGTGRPARVPRRRRAARAASKSTASRSPAARTCSRSAPRGRRPPTSSTCPTARSASAGARRLPRRRVEFTATLQVTRPQYTGACATSRPPRRARRSGSCARSISPDGTQIAFAAVGDIYVMPVGGASRSTSPTTPRSTPIRRGRRTARSSCTRPTRTASSCSSGSAT